MDYYSQHCACTKVAHKKQELEMLTENIYKVEWLLETLCNIEY